MKSALTASLYEESAWQLVRPSSKFKKIILRILARISLRVVKFKPFEAEARQNGEDWPMFGFTMAGINRLSNIQNCVNDVISENIVGDFVECGVWRGGSSIFARAAFDVYGGQDRVVWLADSFEGMPKRTEKDLTDPDLSQNDYLAVSIEQVQANFSKFGLLDERVKFIKGWFSKTLKNAPIKNISILRLDGDYYSSTMDALDALYEKVSIGGFVIVDDYNAFSSCKEAISDFFAKKMISPDIINIDRLAIYWRKEL